MPIIEPKDASEVEARPLRLHINFSLFAALNFTARDIHFCRLEGEMGASHLLNAANVVSCELVNLHAKHTVWRRTDVKDCSLKDTVIDDSDMHFTSWLSNVFIDISFSRVTLTDVVMSDCTFIRAVFTDCNLSHMLMKRCSFIDCTFQRCQTSNKLIEASVLRHTRFEGTDLEVATILENYGLSSTLCSDVVVYLDRPTGVVADLNRLRQDAEGDSLLPIQQLKLAYFITGSLPVNVLERALDVSSWLPLCRVPSSFALLLDGFATFLLGEFENDSLIAAPLLRLYSTARGLAGTLATSTDTPLQVEFEAAIAAASLKLLPIFEQHLELTQALSIVHFPRATFLAEGPTNIVYFDSLLREVLGDRAPFHVESVAPMNSPSLLTLLVEHEGTLATLISVFLASRLRLEIHKLRTQELLETKSTLSPLQEDVNGALALRGAEKLLAFDAGMNPSDRLAYHIRAYALFPQGIAAVLHLDIGLGVIPKLRSVLLDIVRPKKSTESLHPR